MNITDSDSMAVVPFEVGQQISATQSLLGVPSSLYDLLLVNEQASYPASSVSNVPLNSSGYFAAYDAFYNLASINATCAFDWVFTGIGHPVSQGQFLCYNNSGVWFLSSANTSPT